MIIRSIHKHTTICNQYHLQNLLKTNDLWNGPYLTVDEQYDKKWKKILKSTNKKIGLNWFGEPYVDFMTGRNLPFDQLYEVLKGNELYSLQKNYQEVNGEITFLHHHLNSFEDALAAIWNMNIIITSCTSIAHASAALGKETIVFVPLDDFYIWSEGKDKSSWYGDNLTIIRQEEPNNWIKPIKKLKI